MIIKVSYDEIYPSMFLSEMYGDYIVDIPESLYDEWAKAWETIHQIEETVGHLVEIEKEKEILARSRRPDSIQASSVF